MDHKEEQTQELEALAAIYPGEIEVFDEEFPASVEKEVTTTAEYLGEGLELSCTLRVTYTENYPETAPEIELSGLEDIDEKYTEVLLHALNEEAENNLGMVMVFTLISTLQERLDAMGQEILEARRNHEDEKKRKVDEIESKKIEGTKVTVESFLAWKAAFDQERFKQKEIIIESLSKKPTGKEQFLRDATLNISDIKLLENTGGDNMQIDESLFEELDDLDLEEDDDDT